MGDHDICIRAYRRIMRNAKKGIGVHLSAEEVEVLARYDAAVAGAVIGEEEYQADRREEGKHETPG